MEERRRESDRIVRLETVVERMEGDVYQLTATYKEIAKEQQAMFVKSIESQNALHNAVQELTRVMQEQKPRVDELEDNCVTVRAETIKIAAQESKIVELEKKVANHEQWKWKITGMIMAFTIVINIAAWFLK